MKVFYVIDKNNKYLKIIKVTWSFLIKDTLLFLPCVMCKCVSVYVCVCEESTMPKLVKGDWKSHQIIGIQYDAVLILYLGPAWGNIQIILSIRKHFFCLKKWRKLQQKDKIKLHTLRSIRREPWSEMEVIKNFKDTFKYVLYILLITNTVKDLIAKKKLHQYP